MRTRCPRCDTRLRISLRDDDEQIECPECGKVFRPQNLDDDDDDRPAPRRRQQGGAGVPVLPIVGGVGAMLAVCGVVLFLVLRPKPDNQPAETAGVTPAAQPVTQPTAPPRAVIAPTPAPVPVPATTPQSTTATRPPQPRTVFPTRPTPPPRPPVARPFPPVTRPVVSTPDPPEIVELFSGPVDVVPPTIRAATLKPAADALPLDVPTFYSLRMARKSPTAPAKPLGKLSLAEVMKATAFIRVDAGDLSGSGSGFLIGVSGGTALVATNQHVIDAADGPRTPGAPPAKITAVFDSGEPGTERELPATIVASDPINDLAILRVPASGRMPRPIDPFAIPKLTPTMDVNICGFPFGSQLATSGKNPNISVNKGSISSLRLNRAGKLEQVQISGPLNPGNSGGPIVDKDGRLVGVAVATITGSGLGFAVPPEDLIALLEGRLMTTAFLPAGIETGEAKFRVVVPILDPMDQIRTVYVRAWTGDGAAPKGVKDPRTGWKPIERAKQLNLKVFDAGSSLAVAAGELRVPEGAAEVVLQVASENTTGAVAASPPVSYRLNLSDLLTGSDARPMSELTRDLDASAGKVVVVRGRVTSPPAGRGSTQEIRVVDEGGKRPTGVRFLANREAATQFDEVERDQQGLPVRLTCVVGKRGTDGQVPVRVARVDFLGRADQIVRSITAETKDQLASLNRDPAAFTGKTLVVTAAAAPRTARVSAPDTLMVVFPGHAQPRNLSFVTAPGLGQKIAAEKFKVNGLYKVRLTAKVDAVTDPTAAPTRVTVSKVEVLDPKDGTVTKTIE